MTDRQLEQLIRERLDALRAEGTGNWSELNERLDAAEADDDFDKGIAAALGGLSAGTTADWSFMNERLDALDREETLDFDDSVRERIQNFEVPAEPNHWPDMEAKLERTFGLRQRIRRWRLVEAALVALLLLALVGTFDNHHEQGILPRFIEQLWQPNANANTPQPIASLPLAPVVAPDLSTEALPAAEQIIYGPASETRVSVQLSSVEVEAPAATTDATASMPQVASNAVTPPSLLSAEAENIPTEAATETERSGLLSRLGTLFPKRVKEKSEKDLHLKVDRAHEKPHLRIGAVGVGEISAVSFEPLDRNLKSEISQNYSQGYGYGGGLTLGFMYNRFEFETGALYTYRTYSPNHNGRVFGNFNRYVQEWLKRVEYETVEIPANLRFNAYHRRDWRIYGSFGMSLNTVLTTNYDVVRTQSALALDPGSEPSEEGGTKSTLNDLPYPQGLLDGGQFWDNSYLSFNLNVGVEKYVNPRISLYLQPSFSHSLRGRGYGPLQDRFEVFSLRVGTKVTVW